MAGSKSSLDVYITMSPFHEATMDMWSHTLLWQCINQYHGELCFQQNLSSNNNLWASHDFKAFLDSRTRDTHVCNISLLPTPTLWLQVYYLKGLEAHLDPGLCFLRLIPSPNLLVLATSERFLPARGTFKAILASGSHWLQPVLVLFVHWWLALASVGRALLYGMHDESAFVGCVIAHSYQI